MQREVCDRCEQIFLELIAEQCWIENAIECFTNDLPWNVCLKCIQRIINRNIN